MMLAVLDEALRLYPPAPGNFHRVVPEEGAVVCGKFVPGGVIHLFFVFFMSYQRVLTIFYSVKNIRLPLCSIHITEELL